MKNLSSCLETVDKISEYLGKITSFLIIPMVAALVYEVISRYLFNAPTIWAHAIGKQLFFAHGILGGAWVLRDRGHIYVDIIYDRFSPRMKGAADIVTSMLIIILMGVLVWKGGWMALRSLSLREVLTGPFPAPLYPVKMLLPTSALLMLLQQLAMLVRGLLGLGHTRKSLV